MKVNRLKKLMKQKGVTQAELSEIAGTSQAFISYVMKGYRIPSVPVLKRIADYFEKPMDYFLE